MKIILQFHETLSGVISCQAKMQFDIFRGINVTRCKYPFVHIVAHYSIKGVPNDLQRETLIRILEIRKELGYGEREIDTTLRASDIKQRNNQRIRLGITPRNKLQDFKLPKTNRCPSLHSLKSAE